LVQVSKEVFFDMLDKKIMTPQFKQWNITSINKKGRRKKRYVSDDVYEDYQKLLKTEGRN